MSLSRRLNLLRMDAAVLMQTVSATGAHPRLLPTRKQTSCPGVIRSRRISCSRSPHRPPDKARPAKTIFLHFAKRESPAAMTLFFACSRVPRSSQQASQHP